MIGDDFPVFSQPLCTAAWDLKQYDSLMTISVLAHDQGLANTFLSLSLPFALPMGPEQYDSLPTIDDDNFVLARDQVIGEYLSVSQPALLHCHV